MNLTNEPFRRSHPSDLRSGATLNSGLALVTVSVCDRSVATNSKTERAFWRLLLVIINSGAHSSFNVASDGESLVVLRAESMNACCKYQGFATHQSGLGTRLTSTGSLKTSRMWNKQRATVGNCSPIMKLGEMVTIKVFRLRALNLDAVAARTFKPSSTTFVGFCLLLGLPR